MIHVFDDHDRSYGVWREAGVQSKVLVHVDAHHDMAWADDRRSLSIANFISLALQEDIVRAVYWVVPDATWHTGAGRLALRRHIAKIRRRYPGTAVPVRWERRRVQTSVLGRPFVVCSIETLPELHDDVLLDIDTDFLTIPRVSYSEWDRPGRLPWCWPEELVSRLRARNVASGLVTIAYSTDGGYTPMPWKYLGDELAARLDPSTSAEDLRAFDQMRAGMEAAVGGARAEAEAAFNAAGSRLPAAAGFVLAHLLADQDDRVADARSVYARALADDPSYRNPFASPGMSLYFAGDLHDAERSFQRTLTLAPGDPYARLGLGWVAAKRKAWAEAEAHARAALARRSTMVDAHRLLGQALAKQHRTDEAIASLQRALKAALAGDRPIQGVIATDPVSGRILDCDHTHTHALLARLFDEQGNEARALAGYQMAGAWGHDSPALLFRLASLYFRRRRPVEASRHAGRAVQRLLQRAWARVSMCGLNTRAQVEAAFATFESIAR